MREIKFRGIPFDWEQFIYGSYVEYKDTHYVYTEMYEKATHIGILSQVQIDKSTLGQYTGLTDKYGEEIYEGDILASGKIYWTVVFIDGAFYARKQNTIINIQELQNKRIIAKVPIKIVGNVHENPELL